MSHLSMAKYFFLVFTSLSFFLFEGIQIASMNALMPFIQNELNISVTSVGIISSTYFFTICCMLLPAGFLLDKYGPWKIYPVAFMVSGAGMLVFSFSSAMPVILISRSISGFAASFALLGGIKIARLSFTIEKAQFVITIIIASHMCGDMLAQMPLAWLISRMGWRGALAFVALTAIVVSLLCLAILNQLSQKIKVNSDIPITVSLPLILKNVYNPIIWLGALTVIMFDLPILLLGTFFGHNFLVSVYKLPYVTVGSIFSVLYAVLMVSTLAFGYFWKKTSHHFILTMPYIVLSLCSVWSIFYVRPLMIQHPYLPFVCLAIGAAIQNVGYLMLAERIDKHMLALANSCMSLIIVFLATIARPLVGYVIEYKCYPDCRYQILSMDDYQRGGLCLIAFVLIGIISLVLLSGKKL